MNKYSALTLGLAIVLLSSCGAKKEETKTQAETVTESKVNVKVTTVAMQTLDISEKFAATVEPIVKNNIVPNAPGRIRKIMVEVGDKVKKGQKLAQMDVANLSNLESQLDNFKKIYKRVKELNEVGGASQQDLESARLQVTIAETNLKNLQENTFLLSPIDGVVTSRNYDNDDIYNGQQSILTVMQMNPVQMKINVSESYFSKISKGMQVDVELDVYPGKTFNGKVNLVYPTIDERTRTFGVEIHAANSEMKIRPGMFARTILHFGKANRMMVPDLAVIKQKGSGEKYVYLYKDGKVKYTAIELGNRFDDKFEILSGLNEGDVVVVAGQSKLLDGTEVEIVK